MSERNRKLIGSIIGIISFVICVTAMSYAWYSWKSANTNINMGIHAGGLKFLYGDNNIIASSNLSPILDYTDSNYYGDGNNGELIYSDYTAVNEKNDTYKMYAKLNITSIDDALKDPSFKWVLLEKNGNNYTKVISQGTFENLSVGSNNLYTDIYIDANTTAYYRFVAYIDGNMSNPSGMLSASIQADLELCDELVPIIPINLNNQSATTAGSSFVYLKYGDAVYLDENATNKMTTSTNQINLPSKTGYSFGGYYTNTNGQGDNLISTTGYITDKFTNKYFKANTTNYLYAKWTPNIYTITLDGNGTTNTTEDYNQGVVTKNIYEKYDDGIYLDSNATSQKMTASAYSVKIPTRTYTTTYDSNGGSTVNSNTSSYTFKGYYNLSSGGIQRINATGYIVEANFSPTTYTSNTTLYAQWTSVSITLPTPTRTGYSFDGWYDANTGGNKIGNGGASYTPTTSKTLYAHWTDSQAPSASITSTNNVATDQTATLTCTDNVGVVSYYWGTSSTGTPNTSVTSTTSMSVTKTVSSEGTYYLVCKDAAGNTSTSENKVFYKTTLSMTNGTVSPSSVITMAGNSFALPTPSAKTGYSNIGSWYTNSTYTTGAKTYGASYTPSTNATLYSKANGITYTIAYTLNGGTKGTNAPTSGTYDNNVTISNPTRSGYTFSGWTSSSSAGLGNNAKTGTSSNTITTSWIGSSTKNQYFKNLRDNSGTVTLTANWTDSTKPSCSFSNPSDIEYSSTTTIKLTCTDNEAISSQTISTSNFSSSNTSIATIQSVSSATVVNSKQIEYTITIKGTGVGIYNITLNNGVIKDVANNTNNQVTSSNGNVIKKDSSISLAAKSATYTGNAILANTATVTGTTGTVSYVYYTNSTCTIQTTTSTGASNSGAAPVDAGTYYVKATAAADSNYNSVTSSCISHKINQKSVSVTWGNTTTFTYNGSAQGPTATASSGISGETLVINRTTATDPGSYTSTASISSVSGGRAKTSNYTLTNNTKNYTINKKTTTISVTEKTVTYTGSAVSASATANSGAAVTLKYYTNSTCTTQTSINNGGVYINGSAPIFAGTYYVTGTSDENTNYSAGTLSCTKAITINKKNVTISVTEKTVTYTGSAVSANVTTSAPGVSANVSYYTNSTCTTSTSSTNGGASSTNGEPVNAGTYYIKASTYSLVNYNAASLNCTKAITINKKTATITLTPKTSNYTGSAISASATSDSGATVTLKYYTNSTCTTSTSSTNGGASSTNGAPVNPGNYYAKGTSSSTTNYNAGNLSCTKAVTINAITNTVTLNNQSATTAGTTSVTATYGSAMPSITKPQRTYTITYNANGGSVSTTSSNTSATYTFGGYYTSTGGNGTQYYNSSGTSAKNWDLTSNTTLYAKWTGGTVTLPTPTKTGYTFGGWYKESSFTNKVSSSTTYTSNQTLYAKWTRNFTCASVGSTTTYAGKSWTTVSKTSSKCGLALNAKSTSSGTYNEATTKLTSEYIKSSTSEPYKTLYNEKNAGLITTINTNSGTTISSGSLPTGIYWVGSGKIQVQNYSSNIESYTPKSTTYYWGRTYDSNTLPEEKINDSYSSKVIANANSATTLSSQSNTSQLTVSSGTLSSANYTANSADHHYSNRYAVVTPKSSITINGSSTSASGSKLPLSVDFLGASTTTNGYTTKSHKFYICGGSYSNTTMTFTAVGTTSYSYNRKQENGSYGTDTYNYSEGKVFNLAGSCNSTVSGDVRTFNLYSGNCGTVKNYTTSSKTYTTYYRLYIEVTL